jgi:diadenosine tetraphosphate (Ap4A) HIT family hydrolase
MITLHPQLKQNCIVVGRFSLCHLLLMNDASYPWFILVPDRDDVTEIFQLSEDDQQQLQRESSYLAGILAVAFSADKMNIAALGNVVSQLHIHHVVRYKNDPVWPAPIWGKLPVAPYSDEVLDQTIAKLKAAMSDDFGFSI